MASCEIVLCNAVRTAIGAYGGSLKTVAATELGALAIKAVLAHAKLDPPGRALRRRQRQGTDNAP
jgi:acetyl-CoA C-acetyltransferase